MAEEEGQSADGVFHFIGQEETFCEGAIVVVDACGIVGIFSCGEVGDVVARHERLVGRVEDGERKRAGFADDVNGEGLRGGAFALLVGHFETGLIDAGVGEGKGWVGLVAPVRVGSGDVPSVGLGSRGAVNHLDGLSVDEGEMGIHL